MIDEEIELNYEATRQFVPFRVPFYEFCNKDIYFTMILGWIVAQYTYLVKMEYDIYKYRVECSVSTVQKTFKFSNNKILEALHFLERQKLITIVKIPHFNYPGRVVNTAKVNMEEINRRLDEWRATNNKNYVAKAPIDKKRIDNLIDTNIDSFNFFFCPMRVKNVLMLLSSYIERTNSYNC